MCEEYQGFAASLAKVSGTDFVANLTSTGKTVNEPATWDPRRFSDELGKLAARLQETQAEAIHTAIAEATTSTKEGVSAPLVSS